MRLRNRALGFFFGEAAQVVHQSRTSRRVQSAVEGMRLRNPPSHLIDDLAQRCRSGSGRSKNSTKPASSDGMEIEGAVRMTVRRLVAKLLSYIA